MSSIDELFGIKSIEKKEVISEDNINKKSSEITLTQWLNSINYEKNYLMTDENKNKYPQYVINMCLYKNRDIIYYIDALNSINIDNKMHYDFLLNAIPSKKRWAPFSKKVKKVEDIDFVKKYFNVSYNRALEYYNKLTVEDIENIKEIFDEGGIKHVKNKQKK